ncbi:TPA: ABC transporter permease [Vibrio vulnificus]|nr:ABC transporter permease [Vibrio vulnificus]
MFPSKENRQLFRTMVRREVKAKYQGTLLGFLWNLVTPLMMLAIYSTVFLTVFKAKWHLSATEQADYGLMLFVGILTHTYMAEVLTTTSNVIRNNSNLVKKVRFPVAMLPMISVCSAGVNYLFGLILAFAYGAVNHYVADYSYLIYLPFVLLIYVITLTAIAYLVAALGLFIRDVAQMMPVLITVLLFTSTVFFSAQSAPEELAKVLYLNPISPIADAIRSILYGQMPNVTQLLILGLISMVCGWVTYKFFGRLRPSFSDIL